jgi:hypothetical protein
VKNRNRVNSVVVKAKGGDKVDWDKEWNSFVNDRSSSTGSRPNVRTSNRAVPVDPAAKLTKDRIKKEESILLNAWSSGAFQGAGAAAAVLVLLVTLISAGPPPVDRCTLPWC